jgi:uncharacterized protein YbjQ (UPF0145 family)
VSDKSFLSGDLPAHALERLRGLRSQGHPGGVFTSDFSVNEFLFVRKAGFEPVGLCVGSCIYQVGLQWSLTLGNQELTVLSQAMYDARDRAMARLREEATVMGADGVVGVRLTVRRQSWNARVLEFVAIGTGVVHGAGCKAFRGVKGQPFTSDLSGQDFWALLAAGYRPLELVMGSCVYHVARRGALKTMLQAGQNVELTNFSQALYDARELAMERMQNEAAAVQAEGVVGADIHEDSHAWQPHVIEFFAVGTAVVPISGERSGSDIPDPQLVLLLNS